MNRISRVCKEIAVAYDEILHSATPASDQMSITTVGDARARATLVRAPPQGMMDGGVLDKHIVSLIDRHKVHLSALDFTIPNDCIVRPDTSRRAHLDRSKADTVLCIDDKTFKYRPWVANVEERSCEPSGRHNRGGSTRLRVEKCQSFPEARSRKDRKKRTELTKVMGRADVPARTVTTDSV